MRQLTLEGFSEYKNSLNDLTCREWFSFLPMVEEVTSTQADISIFLDDEAKPSSVVRKVVEFFTKRGDSILDVFSGYCNNIVLMSDLERKPTGIEIDSLKIKKYIDAVSQDQFLEPCPVNSGDALSILRLLSEQNKKFNFILVDPPRKSGEQGTFGQCATNISFFSIDDYSNYLKLCLEEASLILEEGRYLVLFVQDYYKDGLFFPVLNYIGKVSGLNLCGMKIFYRDMKVKPIGAGSKYTPAINNFYALIYRSDA